MVPLSAKGIGTTMQCKQDISIIDLGPQLTNNPFERTIVLENKGRRHQALRWITSPPFLFDDPSLPLSNDPSLSPFPSNDPSLPIT